MSLPWVDELKKIIKDEEMQINQKASRAMNVLKSAGLAYNAKLRPNQILVHVANRGGQMVNPHDVVAKGQQISAVGWDLNKVRQSVAIELPHDGDKRSAVIAANEKLADQSSGMLARPFGEERYCSLSSSHLTAFLRCLESGCRMGNDQLSMEQLMAQGGDLQEMVQSGWQWTIISAKAEEECPSLPGLLQQAYNSHLVGKCIFMKTSLLWPPKQCDHVWSSQCMHGTLHR